MISTESTTFLLSNNRQLESKIYNTLYTGTKTKHLGARLAMHAQNLHGKHQMLHIQINEAKINEVGLTLRTTCHQDVNFPQSGRNYAVAQDE